MFPHGFYDFRCSYCHYIQMRETENIIFKMSKNTAFLNCTYICFFLLTAKHCDTPFEHCKYVLAA